MTTMMQRWSPYTRGKWEREVYWGEYLQAPTCSLLMDLQGDEDDDEDDHLEDQG